MAVFTITITDADDELRLAASSDVPMPGPANAKDGTMAQQVGMALVAIGVRALEEDSGAVSLSVTKENGVVVERDECESGEAGDIAAILAGGKLVEAVDPPEAFEPVEPVVGLTFTDELRKAGVECGHNQVLSLPSGYRNELMSWIRGNGLRPDYVKDRAGHPDFRYLLMTAERGPSNPNYVPEPGSDFCDTTNAVADPDTVDAVVSAHPPAGPAILVELREALETLSLDSVESATPGTALFDQCRRIEGVIRDFEQAAPPELEELEPEVLALLASVERCPHCGGHHFICGRSGCGHQLNAAPFVDPSAMLADPRDMEQALLTLPYVAQSGIAVEMQLESTAPQTGNPQYDRARCRAYVQQAYAKGVERQLWREIIATRKAIADGSS